jgi:uncharacterized protein (TIGR03086 family)
LSQNNAVQDALTVESLNRAVAGTRAVLARVRREQFEAPTPCAAWDVHALINHFISVPGGIATRLDDEVIAPDGRIASGDLLGSYDESVRIAGQAFGAPGALERQIVMPLFGEVSGAFILGLITADQFVHGWDLARATGQTPTFDEELARDLLRRVRVSVTDAVRGPEGTAPFGALLEAPAGASAADQLAAFYGRSL